MAKRFSFFENFNLKGGKDLKCKKNTYCRKKIYFTFKDYI